MTGHESGWHGRRKIETERGEGGTICIINFIAIFCLSAVCGAQRYIELLSIYLVITEVSKAINHNASSLS